MSLLDQVSEDKHTLKRLTLRELEDLAEEIRNLIIEVVARNGGHLASNLGAIELTIAIHRVFTIPPDKLVFDVGHQCYTHKILTNRKDFFLTLRQTGGLSGFPCPEESQADIFFTGHAGTAVSQATGLSLGEESLKSNHRIIAVIGDGSLTNGLTFEGLNFLGASRKKLLVILNDNKMSISPTRGALSYYLTRLVTSPRITRQKQELHQALRKIPNIGDDLLRLAEELETKTKELLVPGVFFEKLGLRYLGPIDGHDLRQLVEILTNLQEINEPVLLHVVTKKGKGYRPAEEHPENFHGVGPFDIKTGHPMEKNGPTPSAYVAKTLEEIASHDDTLVVLTAAMEKGLELEDFSLRFPERFLDVGIAESHCVTLASGLAKVGLRPVVAIYSTFLQRAYDQIWHDVCLQGLPVVFLVDRAGVVGEDGATHQGMYDLSYLRTIPRLRLFAPYSLENLGKCLHQCLREKIPSAIRYPRAYLPENMPQSFGSGEEAEVLILGLGSLAEECFTASQLLQTKELSVSAVAVDQVKPLSDEVKRLLLGKRQLVVTVEENSRVGGFGAAVLEYLAEQRRKTPVLVLGLPDDFVSHGQRKQILEKYGLFGRGIARSVEEAYSWLGSG
ncbi:MAG: 1-deoxy-D-xylulose-5-phosphate synthase [Candidatus Omnitrophica bacterium]|nr:1-deoxy-D-xylulose-5-phosphate synthase [Candidatus Omnitrophota bacterium]